MSLYLHAVIAVLLAMLVMPWWHPQLDIATNIINLAEMAMSQFSTPLYLIKDHEHDKINVFRKNAMMIPLGWNADLKSKETIQLKSKANDRSIPLHVYTPRRVKASSPVIIYFHGSGFVVFDPIFFEPVTTRLADETNSIVIAVDYRKAPEHKFPAAIYDAIEVVETVHENADSLGIDKNNIILMGDSAGGHIAAIVGAQKSLYVKGAVLVYPVITWVGYTQSKFDHAFAPLLTTHKMQWYTERYFPHRDNYTHALACPLCNLHNPKLKAPPFMHIIGAEVDPLASDGEEYYRAVLASGQSNVTYTMYNNTIHGFFGVVYLPHGITALLEAARWIKRVYGLNR